MHDLLVLDFSLRDSAQAEDLGAILGQLEEVTRIFEEDSARLGLPKLEGLMPEDGRLSLLSDIEDVHVVSVDVDGLVTDDELLEAKRLVTHHLDAAVADVQLVLVLRQEPMLVRILRIHLDQEEAKLLLVLVRQDVEDAVILIVDDFFDAADLEFFV
jgi:hypothetical protein